MDNYIPRSNVDEVNKLSQHTVGMNMEKLRIEMEEALIEMVSELLEVQAKDIDGDVELSDYGLDYIKIAQLVEKININYKLEWSPSIILEHPTLHALAKYWAKECIKEISVQHDGELKELESKTVRQKSEIEALLCKILWSQLQSIGLLSERKVPLDEIIRKGKLCDWYRRWLEETITVLEQNNYISYDGKTCTVIDTSTIDIEMVWEEWNLKKERWLENPNLKAQIVLLEESLRNLPEILTGKISATDVLFPNSSMKLVEGIYKHNPIADYFNEVMANTVVSYIEKQLKRDKSARFRILEIGAGTGGTSSVIFQSLKEHREYIQEYCYTDVSKAFLMHAEKEYGAENPYLTYKLFNVEEPVNEQGIETQEYDLVIATNVLHATKRIRQTLRNAKAILCKNGLLLINELTSNSLFAHLTFGLLEGWWRYEDPVLRIPGCPGLSIRTWEMVLEEEGFHSIHLPASQASDLGQQVIVAASDGIVRQKQSIKSDKTSGKKNVYNAKSQVQITEGPTQTREQDVPSDILRDKCIVYLKKIVGDTLKMPVHKINSAESLQKYGIDSLLVVQLTNKLRKGLDNIGSTLFFEYQTIDALAEHLIRTQKNSLITLLGLTELEFNNEIASSTGESNESKEEKTSRFLQPFNESSNEIEPQPYKTQDIAIIGLAGRYPGAEDMNEFWDNFKLGKNCITEIPKDRWNWKKYFNSTIGKEGSMYTKWGGFINDIDKFDPLFFHISPAEAETMDPQERLFLEVVYSSIEDSGYTPATLCGSKKVGVFAGVMNGFYSTGASYWSIANRVSYVLNFQGPSMAIDTACSSSLTAIHLALESLYSGVSECAIAGGVNLIVDPAHYLRLTKATMLSKSDQCKSFGDQADGFVDGEGVGAVVLKPLSKAIADGDHIYGVIKGSMINTGGKTHGYSVPNPNAQSQVIEESLERAGIEARTISYVEAHGTGTALGDPIEIRGLTRAFGQHTKDKQFCAIGSAKSNIGHCESAAGVAGITKVLLQLKHGQLAPSLHSKVLNPNIDFTNTPFVVQQELVEWKRPIIQVNGRRKECLRTAGISSFGAGGANAHIVIEEYISKDHKHSRIVVNSTNPALIVLSAKNEERLKKKAKQLLDAIQHEGLTDDNLADMAYTLQVGREAMEDRLAMVVESMKELEGKLQHFVNGHDDDINLYRGQIKRNKEIMAIFTPDEEMKEVVEKWIQNKKYIKLLDLWVKGLSIDWNKLYGNVKPRRMSLPTYPFAKERYWFVKNKSKSEDLTENLGNLAVLHPLLHQNTSDFTEQRYSSTFTTDSPFLSDNVVKGQKILSPMAQLEMARVAITQSSQISMHQQIEVKFKNVAWGRWITIGEQPVQVNIRLSLEDTDQIVYEIYSDSKENHKAEPIVHSQGAAVINNVAKVTTLDLHALQDQCNQSILSSSQCYKMFKENGIISELDYRSIDKVYVGTNQVLVKLSSSSVADNEEYVLHPSLLDATLHMSTNLLMSLETVSSSTDLTLPFTLEEMKVYGQCTSSMWVLIRFNGEKNKKYKEFKFDIDLCDDRGDICVQMKGISLRTIDNKIQAAEGSPSDKVETLLLEPFWKTEEIYDDNLIHSYEKHLVILCEFEEIAADTMANQMKEVNFFKLHSKQQEIDKRFETYVVQIFEKIKNLIHDQPKGMVLLQVVVPHHGEQQLLSGILGLLKSAQIENPKLVVQLIELEKDTQDISGKLKVNSHYPNDKRIRYVGNKRLVNDWKEVESHKLEIKPPWKDRGLYLITGGAGGLGLIFATEIARQVKDAKVVLTGRSPLSVPIQEKLQKLSKFGIQVAYEQVDITQKEEVKNLLQGVKQKYGSLNGIIHGAGVIHDNFILKKTKEEVKEVLAPKVTGLVNLDQASKNLPLDFFLLFSSGVGAFGNAGQADYAAANAFMDGYAKYRNDLVASKQRQGKTLSINWPLWEEGGMRVDVETEKVMYESMGMVPMRTSTGIEALYQSIPLVENQVMVFEGNLSEMKKYRDLGKIKRSVYLTKESTLEVDLDSLREKVIHQLKVQFGEIAKLNVTQIESDECLENYGIDSIMITQLNQKLNLIFGELSKTLFFEYDTLEALAEYFINNYKKASIQWTGLKEHPSSIREQTVETHADCKFPKLKSLRRKNKQTRRMTTVSNSYQREREPIAIIGISGRYPQAKNLKDYWSNLKQGKDCITEIPQERWSLEDFYHPDFHEAVARGKSYSKWGGFIEGFADFDPLFFHMSPREALNLDPQERVFIESCWEALEDAGYTKNQLAKQCNRKVGVFAGITKTGFNLYGPDLWSQGKKIHPYTSFSSVANRISYLLNLQGPSMPIDTMCSSSLTAIHEACEHIHHGECNMAIAGGVNLYLHPANYIALSSQKMLSVDGKCKSFGEGGNGFVPGEGVGVVILKPLSQAIADHDQIYAVIRGTSINHGGKTNGYTVPNPAAQKEVIQNALDKAGVNARTVSYVEAHGTGTDLGDPIEVTGLTQAFRKDTEDTSFCEIGSVKSNIGHLEAAAGIAGITKVVLQMKHQQIVPSLHSEILNPNINFSRTPFVVHQELSEWKRPVVKINGETKEYPRIAGISSFGAGGANAHIILEEYIPMEQQNPSMTADINNPTIILLSARNENQLKKTAQQLLDEILEEQLSESNLINIAYTLQVGREAMEERLAIVVGSLEELKEKLISFVEGRNDIADLYRGQIKRNKETLSILTTDEDIQQAVDAWIAKRKYGKLLNLWVKGLVVDWNKLYEDNKPYRISLPTYPFARERFWINDNKGKKSVIESSQLVAEPKKSVLLEPELKNAVVQHSLKPVAEVEKPLLSKNNKIRRVSLPALSSAHKLTRQLKEDAQQLTLSPTESTVTVGRDNDKPKSVLPKQLDIQIQSELVLSLAEMLSMQPSEIDIDSNFTEIGLDSIIGVEWIQSINKKYELSIQATKLYDYPTVRELSNFMKENFFLTKNPPRSNLVVSEEPVGLMTEQKFFPHDPFGNEKQANGEQSSTPLLPLQEQLKLSLADILSMKPKDIDIDTNFIEMGLDSILSVEWIQSINKQYGLSISATKVYDYPNICTFAEFLEKQCNIYINGMNPQEIHSDLSLSLQNLMEKVQQGSLNIDQADQLFHQYYKRFE
ncbi:hypothetical protein CON45_21560 [Priestia megaterium]|nr:SDR family NAD(P)-dependent oxidoreductase [Priestia megaterium]PEA37029.1 hypothetical protein CON45_21560 [Priestia megaterium]PEE48968.1 hypothetical protein COM71_02755 [Priestia megaterium]